MTTGLSLSIDSDLAAVPGLAHAVRAACTGRVSAAILDEIEIAVVEAINNIITHGYDGRPGHRVRLQLCLQPGAVVIDILDQARPMAPGLFAALPEDPFAFDATDRAALAESGRGLALIRLTMDGVAYRSEGGENRLRLTKGRRVP